MRVHDLAALGYAAAGGSVNPYLVLAALLAVMAAGVQGFRMGVDHEVAAQAREDQHIAQAVDAANGVAAEAIAKLRPKYTTIQNEVQREVTTEVRYTDCRHSAGVMLQLDKALRPPNAASAVGGELPGVNAPR